MNNRITLIVTLNLTLRALTLADARRQISEHYLAGYVRDEFGKMLVLRNTDHVLLRSCRLIRREGLNDVDIGFAFLAEYRGQGLALEAAHTALAYGCEVLKLRRVVGTTLPTNAASI